MCHRFQALSSEMVACHHRHAPRAPLPAPGVIVCAVISRIASEGISSPSSLIRAHTPGHKPPADAGRSLFQLIFVTPWRDYKPLLGNGPSRSRRSGTIHMRRCLDPYPAGFSWCTFSLLPRRQRPHPHKSNFQLKKRATTSAPPFSFAHEAKSPIP